jgi:predicted ArsR family transcriptional regulator
MDDLDRGLDAAASLGDPVRRRLYRYVLASVTPVTRDDVAAGTGLPRSTAAYHLDKLADAGLLDVRFERLTGRSGPGAGRPAKLYTRPREPVAVSLPRRRYELLAGLLAEAVERSDEAMDLLRDAARRYGAALARSMGVAEGICPSIRSALAEIGYEPYDGGGGGRDGGNGVLRLRNCPFERVADRHRDLVCGASLALVDGIVTGLGHGTAQVFLDPGPDRCCVAVRPAS